MCLCVVFYWAMVMAELSPMQGKLTTSSPYSLMDTDLTIHMFLYYASLSSGDAYSDRRLTLLES